MTGRTGMLTLRELLRNPIFAQAKVVAGEKGLNQTIEWSHIIDVPEVVEMASGLRQLIITTGQGLPHEPEAQAQFIADLAQAGLAGMVISVGGKFFQQIPETFITAADRWNFPIITIPRQVRFLDITRIIHEQIISHQYALLKQSDHIHQTLTHIVLEGGGMQELAEALARLVNRAVTIEDLELNVLAYAGHGEIDRARQESIEAGGTPDVIRRFVQEQGILDRLQQSLRPAFVPAWPEHGMTKERIVAPIVVERKVYGYMWLIAGDEPLNELDTMAIERAAIVAALLMLKETAVQQTEARLQADVLSQLLSEHPHSLALADKAERLGLNLNQPHRVMLLRPPAGTLPSLRLANKLRPVVQRHTTRAILQPLGPNLVLVFPAAVNPHELAHNLLATLPDLKIGIGSTAPALSDLARSYRQAEESLEIGVALNNHASIFNFEELGFLHWLYHLPPEARSGNRYAERIKILATEERAARAQLLRTLEVFLDCGGNAAETARVLNIHRNTLTYRLRQIETCCGVSLNDPETRLNLQIAVKAYRLESGGNEGAAPA